MGADEDELVVYPDSDGERIAEDTLQFDWIVLLKTNLDALFDDFVAGDLLWYPVQGDPGTRRAPDVLVALGRPKGHRGSYRQWEEDGVAPQLVIEVLSPGNRPREMEEKRRFYERFGVTEYVVIDPDAATFTVWVRTADDSALQRMLCGDAWTSTLVPLRLVSERDADGERVLTANRPDGTPFRRLDEVAARAERLAARLRELGVDPDEV